MTACVNRKHTKKVAAVVTASLVGALSLGVAPVAAMAEDTGIEVLATDQSNVAGATVEYESSSTTFYYTGKGLGRVPVSVTDGAGVKHDIDLRDGGIKDGEFCYYYVEIDHTGTKPLVNSNGTTVNYYDGKVKTPLRGTSVKDASGAYTMPTDKGDYAVVIAQYKGGQWYLRGIADTFSIVGFSLNDAKLVDGRDVTDTVFEINPGSGMNDASAWESRLGVAVGNHVLTRGDDYTIDIVEKDNGLSVYGNLVPGVVYQAVIDGTPEYEGHKVIDFQVSKLDLGDASIIGKTLVDYGWWNDPDQNMTFTGMIEKINNADNPFDTTVVDDNQFTVNLISTPDGKEYDFVNPAKGVYTYKITAKSSNPYFTGSKEFTIIYADNGAFVNFNGCGDNIGGNVFYVNSSEDKPTIFDISHIKVTPDVDYTVTVTDDEGNVIDMAGKTQLTEPGTYYVKVDVLSWGSDGKLTAGSDVAKVIVEYGSVYANTDIFMTYKGQNVVSSASDTYNGTDLSKNMAFTVKAGNKTLVQGTDYTVTFEKQAADGTRTVVDQIVDAGNYIITVDGVTFNESAEFTFRVDALKLAKATPVWDLDTDDATGIDGYLMYTGEVLNPAYRFFDAAGNEIAVPEGSYVVDRYENTKGDEVALKDAGKYYAFFETAKDVENYDFDGLKSDVINVTARSIFLDVPLTGEWYSQVVYDAVNLGYMNGYSGTKLFGAGDSIKRGDVACVLFNMAGGDDVYANDDFAYSNETGYKTGFEDVDGTMYYGKAIAWAHATGVINGYGDGTFKPEQTITAEEFACMIANYAKAIGDDVDGADTAVLDTMTDGDQVSDWAAQSVAWAVENEVMGNGGFIAPHEDIARERVAAMAVNYQPEKLLDQVIEVPDTNPGSTLF
ncbi:S-layer homology domain-containing protein [Collinsella ihumii]|uniref:S-layer homology domain-containing protein n=1 Tax=Collinsella ihumii TaxID=1720204 RepID=A0AAW7JSM3_9ACTN|nr:S-layer homology domain-containing protein [Collinsella ihumii]MDN0070032.1 S-layer homology domain-containing protein [Collinsella ihumii]